MDICVDRDVVRQGGTQLQGQVAIVTGGARGIGVHYARALAQEGASVALFDVVDGQDQASRLNEQLGREACSFTQVDVSDEQQVAAGVADTLLRAGRIDVLVNNAAMFSGLAHTQFMQIDVGVWDRVMAVNVRGPFLMAKHVGPHMIECRRGKIINVSSAAAFKGLSLMLHYVTSKAAMTGFTRTLALELGIHGINVNTLAPGLIESESIAGNEQFLGANRDRVLASRSIKRDGRPEDLLGALIFLASSASDFVNGQTLIVDGGSVTL
jgi:NAD(P)-dependent dehydrogenase (short-subunit alcohol dehydrogenase family)